MRPGAGVCLTRPLNPLNQLSNSPELKVRAKKPNLLRRGVNMARRTLQELAKQVPVTGYLDYRSYLQELYVRAKAATSPYSYLLFAADLGFSSNNMIRLVIAGERRLADKSAQTIVKAL